MSDTKAISGFLEDIDCLAPLMERAERLNIFDILGLSRTEIRHSNMIAWLMDPNANHGLGDEVLCGIIRYAAGGQDAGIRDSRSFTVYREWNCVDLLAVSDSDKYIVCIENKIDTGEHDNQLGRYKELVEGTYPDYRKAYIYLTPAGKTSSDPETWQEMGYGDILQIIEKALEGKQLRPEADLIIRNYTDTIRRYVIKDDDSRSICEEIYRRHGIALERIWKGKDRAEYEELYANYRYALDMIRKYRPSGSTDRIADVIHLWVKERTEEGKVRADLANTTNSTTRFTTEGMSRILPDVPRRKSAWKTENFYFYEVRNPILPSREHELFIQMAVGSENITDELRNTCDRINEFYPAPQKKEDWAYRINFTTKHVIIPEDDDDEKVINQLDEFLETVLSFEAELADKLEI